MPRRTASVGPLIFTGCPSKTILPESGVLIPAIVLTSVDLPAPLSPTSATTSPERISKSTSWRACTGPKLLLTPWSASTGVSVLIHLLLRSSGGRRRPVAPPADRLLLDAGRLAGVRVLRGADLLGRPELILDDRVLDVVLRHGHRRQDHRRHVLLAVVGLGVHHARRGLLALQQVDRQLPGLLGLGLDRLVDGHVLRAREDPLDARQLGVLAGGRARFRVDSVALHRGDGRAGERVVGVIHAHEPVLAERRDRLLGLTLGVGA